MTAINFVTLVFTVAPWLGALICVLLAASVVLWAWLSPLTCRILGHRMTDREEHPVPHFSRKGEFYVFETCARCGVMGRLMDVKTKATT